MTMNETWGYKKNDHDWKSSQTLIRMLSDIASKGGNLLLNIGPRADGSLTPETVDRLEAIGRWMDVNSEAIHATDASPFPRRLPWGRVTQKTGKTGATTLFLHVWEWPADGKILLPTLQELPSSGSMLQGGATVTAERSADGIVVSLPGKATHPDVSVARLEFPGAVTVTQQPYIVPSSDGVMTLLAQDADPHGVTGGNVNMAGSGADAYLTNWVSTEYRIEYHVKTGKRGKWMVQAEVAAPEATQLSVSIGKTKIDSGIPATGEGRTWQTISLGTIELPAEEGVLVLRPANNGWNPIEIRKLILTPAT